VEKPVFFRTLTNRTTGVLNLEMQDTKPTRRQIMKRIAYQLTHSTALVAAVAVLGAFIILAGAGPSYAAPRKSGHMNRAKALTGEHVEARISYLHTNLNITPEQEELWNNVAQVMRDNAKAMDALIKARSENATAMNPLDDLKSYSEIADMHADGLKKFIPAFEALFNTMSDDQKQNAHKIFHNHRHSKSKAKGK
jgi:hypothetical protein